LTLNLPQNNSLICVLLKEYVAQGRCGMGTFLLPHFQSEVGFTAKTWQKKRPYATISMLQGIPN